jgi:glutaryl-CoA dehydrogenase
MNGKTPGQYEGADFYQTDALLSEDERKIRDKVRNWVSSRVEPIMGEHFEKATFPMHLIPEMAGLHALGSSLPLEYGCAAMSSVSSGLIMQELERGDSSLRSFASVQSALVMYPIFAYGSEEQRREWLPKLATGEKIGCFGLTEPDAGSDPASMKTHAVKKDGRWILNGTKSWITNGGIADVAVIWAKTDSEIRGFLLEKGTSGFSSGNIEHKMSLRGSITSWLAMNECAIPDKNLLPKSGGLGSALECLNQARYGIAWGALGAAMSCYHEALEYSKSRMQFGRPIGSFQLVQEKLVYMLTEITKGQLLALHLGRLKDSGNADNSQISLAKRNNTAIALEIARAARDILGAHGITLGSSVIRHMCNLEAVKTYEGTDSIHTLILGQAITGLQAFR